MTFRQALYALRRRWYLIVVVVLLAGAVAAVFVQFQTPVYTSQLVLRASALASTAAQTGKIGTATVDFDPETLRSATILRAAAQRAGESAAAGESWNVAYTVRTGQTEGAAAVLTLSADGRSAALSQEHVTAVATAYRQYLVAQTAAARAAAEGEVAKWSAIAQTNQAAIAGTPATQVNAIAQANLTAALTKAGEASTTLESIDTAGSPLIVSRAAEPGTFQGTPPLLALAVALATGLIAGIGLVLARDALDGRLRSEDEVEAIVGMPSLGPLGYDRRLRRRSDQLPAAGPAGTPLSESLRALRTTIQVLLPAGSGTVVVTSVEPGDGKTFVSSNLAVAWARSGRRVILVGGDLRRPGFWPYFAGAGEGRGLTDLLRMATASAAAPTSDDIAAHLKPTDHPGLRILPAGTEGRDPADLLATASLGDVVRQLRAASDIVVIDSPPSLALADASLLAGYADGTVIVASERRTPRRLLVETADALRSRGVAVLGVVVNRSRRSVPRSYSPYYVGERTASRPPSSRPAAGPRTASAAARAHESPARSDSPVIEDPVIEDAAVEDVVTEDSAVEAPEQNEVERMSTDPEPKTDPEHVETERTEPEPTEPERSESDEDEPKPDDGDASAAARPLPTRTPARARRPGAPRKPRRPRAPRADEV